MIDVKGLSKSFGRNRVLRSIDLMVKTGECVAIFGPNGAGKSTLLQILAGAMKPTAGKVRIGGIDTAEDPISTRRSIGFVSHLPLLYSELSALENLTFYGHMYDVPDLSDRIKEILSQVGLSFRAHDSVRIFSRGMIQRLALARALLHSPQVLLLDEPFTGLDHKAGQVLREILQHVINTEGTVLMATHDFERGLELCHRACILTSGRIVYEAPRKHMDINILKKNYMHFSGGGEHDVRG
jgi:heme exporter protein A